MVFVSASGRGLQHQGQTPIDSSIKVEATKSKIILNKGKFTNTDGTDYILSKPEKIKINPDTDYSKDICVAIIERPDGGAFLWVDERRHTPACLHTKNATSPVMIEVYREMVDQDFQLPPNYEHKQYIIGRKWLEICPTNPPKDYLGEDNSSLCNGCPLQSEKGKIGAIKPHTYSFVNCLQPTTGSKNWGNPLQGRLSYSPKFVDEDGREVYEIPHFAHRAEKISDKLIHNPSKGTFEDKPKKEKEKEISLKKPRKHNPSAKKELLGVVRTKGRPPMNWKFRNVMDEVISFLRNKYPGFNMKTITEMRKDWEDEVKKKLDDFTDQAESLG